MDIFQEIESFLQNPENKKPLIVVLGPTASGKTALSLKIAKLYHGEIISTDSRQVYKYMDIGTDKILQPQQEGVPHHLLDFLEPTEEFTLADYKRLALKTIDEIYRRKHIPMLVGGTGLYINAIIQNYQIPEVPPNPKLRQEMTDFCEKNGIEALYKILQEKDPQAAKRIHPNNIRYVIRALEINLAGNTKKLDTKGEPAFNVFVIGIDWPREELYARINQRVDNQINRGLLNEFKTLLLKGYKETLPSMSSLGYKELGPFVRGECPLEEAVETIKQNTRNYAKRQLTWFKKYKNIHWISGAELEKQDSGNKSPNS